VSRRSWNHGRGSCAPEHRCGSRLYEIWRKPSCYSVEQKEKDVAVGNKVNLLIKDSFVVGQNMEHIWSRLYNLIVDLCIGSQESLATGGSDVVCIHGQDVTSISVEWLGTSCIWRERATLCIVSDVLFDILDVHWRFSQRCASRLTALPSWT
jgi:hypothetical protein